MKISLKIVQDYIELHSDSLDQLESAITEKTAEVDEIEIQGQLLRNCCVGRIATLQKHPNADKLNVCTVETDKGIKPIVCGGTNLREGMCIAFAHVGAKVKTPKGELFELGAITIRGEQSEGMICANMELGLEDLYPESDADGERPVIDLGDADNHVGESLQDFLGLNDTIIHIDNHAITHRPDLFSHIGFARELVAMGLASWKKQPEVLAPEFGNEPLPFAMNVTKPELMPRYMSCVVKIDAIGETPQWMKSRLAATGWRSVNLPVDITNYVLLEYGLPLHSFDADDIQGNVTMRPAHAGEIITTLDGAERPLSEGALILEDDAGIFDLLGIMGGLRSSTKSTSAHLYVHAASLDTVSIRKAMIAMGHRTDAGTVYEKGVQPITVEQGFYRTIELMLQLIPGAKVVSVLESVGSTSGAPSITVSLEHIIKQLGVELPAEFVETTLQALGFNCESSALNVWHVTPPLWRRDCTGVHDIVEEVARMYGYNSIDSCMPCANITPPARNASTTLLRSAFTAQRYLELLPLSLVGPSLLQKTGFNPAEAVVIQDPIGEELSVLQPSVLPQLLQHAADTVTASEPEVKTHTVSHVFSSKWPEFTQLGVLVAKQKVSSLLQEPLYVLQQDLAEVLHTAGYTVTYSQSGNAPDYAHSGRTALIQCQNTVVGEVFQVHPAVLANMQIKANVAVALLDYDVLLALPPVTPIARTIAAYPAITYDETISYSMAQSVAALLIKLQSQHELLESVTVVDVYAKDLPATEYKLTLRFTYRSAQGTLKESELQPIHQEVLKSI